MLAIAEARPNIDNTLMNFSLYVRASINLHQAAFSLKKSFKDAIADVSAIPENIFTRIYGGSPLTNEERKLIAVFYRNHPTGGIETVFNPQLKKLLLRHQNQMVAPAIWMDVTNHFPDLSKTTLHMFAGAAVALLSTSCGSGSGSPPLTPVGPKAWYAPAPQIRETVVPGIGTLKTNKEVPKGNYMYVIANTMTMEQAMLLQNNPNITLIYDIAEGGQLIVRGFLLPLAVIQAGITGNLKAAIEGDDVSIYYRDGKMYINGQEVQARQVRIESVENTKAQSGASANTKQNASNNSPRLPTQMPTISPRDGGLIWRSKGPPSGQPYFYDSGEVIDIIIYRANGRIEIQLSVETNGEPGRVYPVILTYEELSTDLQKVVSPHMPK